MKFKAFGGRTPDYIFIVCALLLTVFGLVMLSSASSDLGKIKFDDTYYYLKHQIIYGLGLGAIGFLFAFFIDYRFWQRIAAPLLILNLFLLVLVFTPLGFSHAGASRWLDLGFMSIQPAELLKFSFIVYLAAWLAPRAKGANKDARQKDFWAGYFPFLVICGLVAVLVVIQRSTSAVAIIMAAGLLVYFASGARISYILSTILIGLVAFGLLISFSPYRLDRVETYFKMITHSESIDYESSAFQVNQSLISIGSGGLTGVGFGQSTAKFKRLPEPISDSIFAVIAEELGFVGAASLIAIFGLFFVKGFMIAKKTSDQFAKFVIVGFTSVMAIQTFINIAAISGLMPLTGVPLPFISYGGTSLAVFLTMTGVIGNISKYN
ncbi:MAG: putative peptidoglycan glycosyltransferase FtsW [Candidatus Paceibacterota bacterium]